MNPSPPPNAQHLQELLEAHFCGNLSAAGKEEFAALLDGSAEARRLFVELAGFESALTGIHQSVPAVSPAAFRANGARSRRLWIAALPLLAAAACVAVVFWPQNDVRPKPSPTPLTARLVNEAGAVFARHREPGDSAFGPGLYELQEGMVHLRFASGADLVIQAPAGFEITDAMHARLHWGRVRSIVPPSAKGFTIATNGVDYEDVGTEFGLRVERDTGASAMHVFEGQVNVRKPSSGSMLKSVEGGGSVAYHDGLPVSVSDLLAKEFIAPGSIGYQRWKSHGKGSLDDPGLIAFFSFARRADQPALLSNECSASTVSSGTIHGARWVSGRWPGKDALLFDQSADFAEIEIPGEFTELTIAAWVSIERLDHTFTTILDSNGWESGDIHLQLQRSGFPHVDIRDAVVHGGGKWFGAAIPTGKWSHLAAVISRTTQMAKVYVNGRLSYERPLKIETPLRPGLCRIGNWLPSGDYEPVRAFNGRMDELAIWNRALSQKELETQVERGRPDFLWSGKSGKSGVGE